MATSILCPKCSRKLKVPEETLGRRVKCPGCGEGFVAGEAPPEDDTPDEVLPTETEEPRPPVEKLPPLAPDEVETWENVHTAFTVQGASHVLYLLGTFVLVLTIFTLMLRAGSTATRPADAQLSDRFFGLCLVVGGALVVANWAGSMVAGLFGSAAPLRRRARPLALAGAAAAVLATLKLSGYLLLPFAEASFGEAGGPLRRTILGSFLGMISGTIFESTRLVVLALYARSVGRLLRDRTLTNLGTYLALGTVALYLLVMALDLFLALVDDTAKKSDSRALAYLSLFLHALPLLLVQLAGAALLLKARQTVASRLPKD